MSTNASFVALADERFVSLTTFRRAGVPVPTAVWIARDGDDLIVTTPKGSGKVKRLRNNSTVEMRPCNRAGRVHDDAPVVFGDASILDDDESRNRLSDVFGTKYGFEYRVFMLIERLGKSGQKDRVMLRITPA